MNKILSLILETKRRKLEVLNKNRQEIEALVKDAPKPISFKQAIQQKGKVSLIAEIKQASPASGVLRKQFSPVEIAKLYEKLGVNAISVLTEEEFFLGRLQYIEEIKKEVKIPILRKDFILDEIEILESRAVGADAVLLIVSILDDEKFNKLYKLSKELGMDVLVEVHTIKELNRVLNSSLEVDIIGINNRSLHSLKVDITTTEKLIHFFPPEIVKVSESGIKTTKDVLWLKGLGIDAILVGEAIMKEENIEAKIKELHLDREEFK